MGFLNIVIKEGLYDKDFVKKWTNAPHLIRQDTGKLLRESDLDPKGAAQNFVVWDKTLSKTVIWDSGNACYKANVGEAALEGEFDITLGNGSKIKATTVWNQFCARAAEYPVEKVAQITWLKEKDIIEAAHLYAKSKPASIQWGLAIDSTPAVTPTATAIAALWSITGNLDVPGGNPDCAICL